MRIYITLVLTVLVLNCCKEKKTRNIDICYYEGDSIANQILCFKEGVLDGAYFSFYPNGHVKAQEFYSDGLKNGANYYFNDDGTLESIKTYKSGVQDGIFIGYYPSGNKRYFMNYFTGKPTGEAFEYKDTTSTFLTVKLYYNDNGEIIKREYY